MRSQLRLRAQQATDFLLAPASARPLAALRIGLTLTLLLQAYLLRGELLELFSSAGYVQGALVQSFAFPGTPTVAMISAWGGRLSLSEDLCIYLAGGLYLISLVFLGLGLLTRTASIAAWFLHWTFMNSNDTTNYGADLYAQIFLFYLMLAPAGGAWSLDVLLHRVNPAPSSAARLCLRMMQCHLCISYLASGIEKASGSQWWNGQLLWRALSMPIYRQYDMSWLIDYPWLTLIGGWATLVFELGYIVFIWPRRTRRLWIAAMVSLHLGIAVFMGLGIFGLLMAMLTPALFGISPEPEDRALTQASSTRRLWALSTPSLATSHAT